jgi:hypothetical protein
MMIERGRLVSITADSIKNGNLIVPEEVKEIADYVFYRKTNLISISLPTGLAKISDYAFMRCSSLTTITLPAGLTAIGNGAFADCSSLTAIDVPAGLTELGDFVFSGCSSLTTITLPAELTAISNYAFEGCSNLTTITLPPRIKIFSSAFNDCDHLESIIVASDDTAGIEAIKEQLPDALIAKVISRSEHAMWQQYRPVDPIVDAKPSDIPRQTSNASTLLKVLSGFMAALGAAALMLALASWTPAATVVTGIALLAGSYGLFKYANNQPVLSPREDHVCRLGQDPTMNVGS